MEMIELGKGGKDENQEVDVSLTILYQEITISLSLSLFLHKYPSWYHPPPKTVYSSITQFLPGITECPRLITIQPMQERAQDRAINLSRLNNEIIRFITLPKSATANIQLQNIAKLCQNPS